MPEADERRVLNADRYHNNGELIDAVAYLRYLRPDWLTLDATFGRGTFWKVWRPERLVTLDRFKGHPMLRGDFRRLPFRPHSFQAVVLDGPYRLNGTPDQGEFDDRYGVDQKMTWQDKHQLICDGITSCVEVLGSEGTLLVKCQDQVCSGAVRFQTRVFTEHAEALGCELVDMLHLIGNGRRQPERTRKHPPCKGKGCAGCDDGREKSLQYHAHSNMSSALVLRGPKIEPVTQLGFGL